MILIIPIYAFSLLFKSEKLLISAMILIAILLIFLIVWTKIYNFKKDYNSIKNRTKIYSYFASFSGESLKLYELLYRETIKWCWWDLKESFHKTDDDKELWAFKLFIADEKDPPAIANSDFFQKTCQKLSNEQNAEERTKILQDSYIEVNTAHQNNVTSQRILSRISYKSFVIYIVILLLHIGGCVLSSFKYLSFVPEQVKLFIENFLFYIPSDILLILIYFGIVKDKKQEEPIKTEVQNKK